MKPLILVDMDGPLADFDGHGFTELARAGIPLDIDHPSQQRHRYFTGHLLHKHHHREVRKMISTPGWFEALPVTKGAREGIDALLSAGADLWVCTKPLEDNPTCRDGKGAWLRQHFPELEDRLIIAPDKSLIKGDVLLDDAPKRSWFGAASWRAVIFTMPFNGEGSEWEHLPHWDWSRPVNELLYWART